MLITSKFIRISTLFLVLLVGSGCATIDWDAPKSESRALTDTSDTSLARLLSDEVLLHPQQAGFYPIYEGIDALALRLLMAERAEKSIDAQYFLIYDDIVGNVFAHSLLAAANRGVRVRFLLDDVLSQGLDPGLATLDSHENIEVRVFNPFANRRFRALDAPTSLGRITRRMHNKSFTVDNQVSLIGGRNIAGEYFGARSDVQFADLDVLTVGPVVGEVSDTFDTYWNHTAAIPIAALADVPDDAVQALATYGQEVAEALADAENSQYAQALRGTLEDYMDRDLSAFTWADYQLVVDSPDKSQGRVTDASSLIGSQMTNSIGEIKEELFVVTAYFVLSKREVEQFRQLRNRGVDVTIVTNSLASNNHSAAHAGYVSSRKALLEMGVKLFELRAGQNIPADQKVSSGTAVSTMHAKTFVVDREKIFIGSFNWNQRSENRDTELGVIINSPKLATELLERVEPALPTATYQVFLNDSGKVRWRIEEDGKQIVLTKEPQTGFWRRFGAGFMRLLPIKSQL